MGSSRLLRVLCGVLVACSLARAAAAFSRPMLDLGVGTTLGADSKPNGGGATGTLTGTWPVLDRARFGAQVFADDIGTTLGQLTDPNDGADLGKVGERHRWAWGGAWYGETDVWKPRRWTITAAAAFGWWRTEDDLRGANVAAVSSIGTSIGLDVRRASAGSGKLGAALRFKKIYKGGHPGFDRVGHYGSAALTWRWNLARRP